MLSIGEKEVVTGFTKYELDILDNLLSERKANMNSHLNTIDKSKYVDLCQLQGKISGLVKLFEFENSKK